MECLESEELLKSPICLKNEQFGRLMLHLETVEHNYVKALHRDIFYLLVHDTWSFLELGADYKNYIRDEQVTIKQLRLFFLGFVAANKQYKKNQNYFKTSTVKNFFIATSLVKKMLDEYVSRSEEIVRIEENKKVITNQVGQDKNGDVTNRDALSIIQGTYFKELYKRNQFFDTILLDIIKQTTAAEKLLGEDLWHTVKDEDIGSLLNCLENNHFTEVHFWKEILPIERFIKCEVGVSETFVFCVQQDHSMLPYINLQTALGLAISDISKKCHYDFIFLPFAQSVEQETIALKGNISAETYFELVKNYNSTVGKINYKPMLNFAFTMFKLELSKGTSGKIILLCNELLFDYLPADEAWKAAVEQYKRKMEIEIVVIYFGVKSKLQQIWFADQVILEEDFVSFKV